MKTGYSFGSLVSFVEALNAAAVKITGDQTIGGLKTFSSNPITSAAQGSGGGYLTRKDYVDGELALKAPLASPALTGTPTAPTAEAGTNTTQIATTAFVTSANTAQLATTNPLMDGTVAVGTSTLLARQDHRHPTDTTRAPLASPSFTGIPTAPTAAGGTDNTQLATTAFVQSTAASIVTAKASSATPLMDGTATAGTSTNYAREDHVHPTDTSRAPLASPALTGTPTAPTAEAGTNTTQIATTAFVQSAAASGLSFRNKIVDGRFDFWYEGTSQTSNGYGSDTMWRNENIGSTKNHSRQSLNPGVDLPAIHVPSARYFSRTEVSSVAGVSNYVAKSTKIENVRTLAGKKATLSFYAKADAAKDLGVHIYQSFGTGGGDIPSEIVVVQSTKLAITNQWVRYSLTFDIPSIYGKTLGANNNDALNIIFGFDRGSSYGPVMGGLGHQSGVFDLACIQLEEGEQATKFEELPMSISENLVGRYYETSYPNDVAVGTPGTEGSRGGYRGFVHPKAAYKAYGAATQFRVAKRKTPAVSVFHVTTGVKGSILFNEASLSVSTIGGVGQNGFATLSFNPAPTVLNADAAFHYVADARL